MSSTRLSCIALLMFVAARGMATGAPIIDPNDPRNWQGATVGTFAALYYGADTLANRQLVVDDQLLDDGIFNSAGFLAGSLLSAGAGCCSSGYSTDLTGTGSYAYVQPSPLGVAGAASAIDNHWIQTSGAIGQTVWDLGFLADKAAIFNTIDHGPIPQEAIESTAYLSNDLLSWTQASVERVFLEGFMPNTGILWDGFAFVVGTGTTDTFRYISITHGGPGALIQDGDDEINGVMGLTAFTPHPVPEPATASLLVLGCLSGYVARRRRRSTDH